MDSNREDVRSAAFADHVILYLKDPKDSTKTFSDLMKTKAVGFKISKEK